MTLESQLDEIWFVNKSRFPITLQEEGENGIELFYLNFKLFILDLAIKPSKINFTMTKEYHFWFSLSWEDKITFNVLCDINTSEVTSTIEVFINDESLGTEEKSWNDMKTYIIELINKMKNP